jgi:hypothetical protein
MKYEVKVSKTICSILLNLRKRTNIILRIHIADINSDIDKLITVDFKIKTHTIISRLLDKITYFIYNLFILLS